jgi:hypothetical protein
MFIRNLLCFLLEESKMKRRLVIGLIIAGILTTVSSLAFAGSRISSSMVPLPPSEASLPVI